jgi:hypothetical protein
MKTTISILLSASGCLCFSALVNAQETTYEFIPDPAGGFDTPSYITFSSPTGSFDALSADASVTDAITAFWINLPGNVSFALGAPPSSDIPTGILQPGQTDLADWGSGSISDLDLFVSGDGVSAILETTEINNSPYESLPSYWDQEVVGIPFSAPEASTTLPLLLVAVTALLGLHAFPVKLTRAEAVE